MPLYDIFHRPLSLTHEWETLHLQWAGAIAADLNRRLPRRFLAHAPYHLGAYASADVAEVELSPSPANGAPTDESAATGGIAVATEPILYTPPATDLAMPVSFPPEYRVEVRDTLRGSRVLAVVELVSPGNKDDADARQTFAGKCLSYLAKGIGLLVVDVVTERRANLHNVIVQLAEHDPKFEMLGDPPTYAAAYRPAHRNGQDLIDLWHWPLAVDSPLPTVPLALRGFGCVALNLEATYAEACERSRIP